LGPGTDPAFGGVVRALRPRAGRVKAGAAKAGGSERRRAGRAAKRGPSHRAAQPFAARLQTGAVEPLPGSAVCRAAHAAQWPPLVVVARYRRVEHRHPHLPA
ncbi:MAG: hypothetical protein WCF08_02385, partial [Anaerolineaceae bacterium]